MDARPSRSFTKYKLVNKATGAVEAEGLGRVDAMDQQNQLWARGVKTDVVEE